MLERIFSKVPEALQRFLERLIFPLALIAGALGLAYWYWTTTPSYAVNSIVDSLKQHDVQTFEKYVDVDSVASHAFDDLLEGPAREEILGRMGRMDSFLGAGFIRFFKRDIINMAHERLVHVVADPGIRLDAVTDSSTNTLGSYHINPRTRQTLVDYGLSKYGFRGIKYLQTQGNDARLGLEFFSPRLRNSYIVEFRLEDAGGYWRVTQLTNLPELLERYIQTKNWPTPVSSTTQ